MKKIAALLTVLLMMASSALAANGQQQEKPVYLPGLNFFDDEFDGTLVAPKSFTAIRSYSYLKQAGKGIRTPISFQTRQGRLSFIPIVRENNGKGSFILVIQHVGATLDYGAGFSLGSSTDRISAVKMKSDSGEVFSYDVPSDNTGYNVQNAFLGNVYTSTAYLFLKGEQLKFLNDLDVDNQSLIVRIEGNRDVTLDLMAQENRAAAQVLIRCLHDIVRYWGIRYDNDVLRDTD